MYSQESVLKLVELVYASACDPDEWPRLLDSLCELVGGSGADLASFDLQKSAAQFRAGVGIIGPEFRKEYLPYYMECDPWVTAAKTRRLFRTGTIAIGESLVPMRDLEKTEFYNDFGRRFEYTGGLSGIIAGDLTSGAAISVCRRKDCAFGEAEVALIRTLMPHLRRALQIHERLVEAEVREPALRDTLNRLATGALLVEQAGRVLFVNDSARETLAQRDGLTIDRGMLRAERPHETTVLLNLIAGAAETCAGDGMLAGDVLLLSRPSGRRALQVIVSPLPPGDEARTQGRAGVFVFITDPECIPETDVTVLRRIHGFSRAEADVARLLLQDKTVREIGDLLCVSVNTVRFHLKNLFSKTSTRRQSELVRLLLTTAQMSRMRAAGQPRRGLETGRSVQK